MTIKELLFMTVLSFSWTVSYEQTPVSDTAVCYNKTELKKIALALIDGKEYKELYQIKTHEVNILDSLLLICNLDKMKAEAQRNQYQFLANGYAKELKDLKQELRKQKLKNRWLRIGLGASVGLFTGVLTYLLIK